ncbi:MAG: hypothetical protein AB1757_20355 [Acidobacteriota bacterium]
MGHRLLVCLLIVQFGVVATLFAQQGANRDEAERERVKRAVENNSVAGKDEPATRIEKFLHRKNVLLIKEITLIGAVPGQAGSEVRIETLAISQVGEVNKVYGLRITRAAARGDHVGFIDFDELGALQTAFDYLLKTSGDFKATTVESATATTESRNETLNSASTEMAITTRDGLKFGLIQQGKQQTGFIQINGLSESTVSFGIGALGRLRNLLLQSRQALVIAGAK